jgi:hypothetical protein
MMLGDNLQPVGMELRVCWIINHELKSAAPSAPATTTATASR